MMSSASIAGGNADKWTAQTWNEVQRTGQWPAAEGGSKMITLHATSECSIMASESYHENRQESKRTSFQLRVAVKLSRPITMLACNIAEEKLSCGENMRGGIYGLPAVLLKPFPLLLLAMGRGLGKESGSSCARCIDLPHALFDGLQGLSSPIHAMQENYKKFNESDSTHEVDDVLIVASPDEKAYDLATRLVKSFVWPRFHFLLLMVGGYAFRALFGLQLVGTVDRAKVHGYLPIDRKHFRNIVRDEDREDGKKSSHLVVSWMSVSLISADYIALLLICVSRVGVLFRPYQGYPRLPEVSKSLMDALQISAASTKLEKKKMESAELRRGMPGGMKRLALSTLLSGYISCAGMLMMLSCPGLLIENCPSCTRSISRNVCDGDEVSDFMKRYITFRAANLKENSGIEMLPCGVRAEECLDLYLESFPTADVHVYSEKCKVPRLVIAVMRYFGELCDWVTDAMQSEELLSTLVDRSTSYINLRQTLSEPKGGWKLRSEEVALYDPLGLIPYAKSLEELSRSADGSITGVGGHTEKLFKLLAAGLTQSDLELTGGDLKEAKEKNTRSVIWRAYRTGMLMARDIAKSEFKSLPHYPSFSVCSATQNNDREKVGELDFSSPSLVSYVERFLEDFDFEPRTTDTPASTGDAEIPGQFSSGVTAAPDQDPAPTAPSLHRSSSSNAVPEIESAVSADGVQSSSAFGAGGGSSPRRLAQDADSTRVAPAEKHSCSSAMPDALPGYGSTQGGPHDDRGDDVNAANASTSDSHIASREGREVSCIASETVSGKKSAVMDAEGREEGESCEKDAMLPQMERTTREEGSAKADVDMTDGVSEDDEDRDGATMTGVTMAVRSEGTSTEKEISALVVEKAGHVDANNMSKERIDGHCASAADAESVGKDEVSTERDNGEQEDEIMADVELEAGNEASDVPLPDLREPGSPMDLMAVVNDAEGGAVMVNVLTGDKGSSDGPFALPVRDEEERGSLSSAPSVSGNVLDSSQCGLEVREAVGSGTDNGKENSEPMQVVELTKDLARCNVYDDLSVLAADEEPAGVSKLYRDESEVLVNKVVSRTEGSVGLFDRPSWIRSLNQGEVYGFVDPAERVLSFLANDFATYNADPRSKTKKTYVQFSSHAGKITPNYPDNIADHGPSQPASFENREELLDQRSCTLSDRLVREILDGVVKVMECFERACEEMRRNGNMASRSHCRTMVAKMLGMCQPFDFKLIDDPFQNVEVGERKFYPVTLCRRNNHAEWYPTARKRACVVSGGPGSDHPRENCFCARCPRDGDWVMCYPERSGSLYVPNEGRSVDCSAIKLYGFGDEYEFEAGDEVRNADRPCSFPVYIGRTVSVDQGGSSRPDICGWMCLSEPEKEEVQRNLVNYGNNVFVTKVLGSHEVHERVLVLRGLRGCEAESCLNLVTMNPTWRDQTRSSLENFFRSAWQTEAFDEKIELLNSRRGENGGFQVTNPTILFLLAAFLERTRFGTSDLSEREQSPDPIIVEGPPGCAKTEICVDMIELAHLVYNEYVRTHEGDISPFLCKLIAPTNHALYVQLERLNRDDSIRVLCVSNALDGVDGKEGEYLRLYSAKGIVSRRNALPGAWSRLLGKSALASVDLTGGNDIAAELVSCFQSLRKADKECKKVQAKIEDERRKLEEAQNRPDDHKWGIMKDKKSVVWGRWNTICTLEQKEQDLLVTIAELEKKAIEEMDTGAEVLLGTPAGLTRIANLSEKTWKRRVDCTFFDEASRMEPHRFEKVVTQSSQDHKELKVIIGDPSQGQPTIVSNSVMEKKSEGMGLLTMMLSSSRGSYEAMGSVSLTVDRRHQPEIIRIMNELVYEGRIVPGSNLRTGYLSALRESPFGAVCVLDTPYERFSSVREWRSTSSINPHQSRLAVEMARYYLMQFPDLLPPGSVYIVCSHGGQVREIMDIIENDEFLKDRGVQAVTIDNAQGSGIQVVITCMTVTDPRNSGQGFIFSENFNRGNVAISRCMVVQIVLLSFAMFEDKCSLARGDGKFWTRFLDLSRRMQLTMSFDQYSRIVPCGEGREVEFCFEKMWH